MTVQMTDARTLKCQRCRKRYRGKGDWNATVVQGVVSSVTCPNCQTVEEHSEAVIHEATLNYGRDNGGRVIGKPK